MPNQGRTRRKRDKKKFRYGYRFFQPKLQRFQKKIVKKLVNLTESNLNINDHSRRVYYNRFTDLTNLYLIILYIIIKLIFTSTLILKHLIAKDSF